MAPTPLVGILLAAGASTRFGGDKLLHRVDGATPMAAIAARRLRPACDRVLAVVRPGSEALAKYLLAEGCDVVVSDTAIGGMGHSLAAGVRASADAAGWLIALADMPFITSSTFCCVVDTLRGGGSIVVPEYQGRRGHPVGFSRRWAPQLAALEGDQGARAILAAFPDAIERCAVDDAGVLRDVDHRADLV
jgi:molybdenum cofactor cytidylyltransferase